MVQTTMNNLFEESKTKWLDEARKAARILILDKGRCTIEDVLEACPRPSYLHRNTTGSVFQSDEFEPLGYTASKRRQSHGRVVRIWGFVRSEALERGN